MLTEFENGNFVAEFDSLTEIRDDTWERKSGYEDVKSNDESNENSRAWFGCKTSEAKARAAHGWPKGVARLWSMEIPSLPEPRIMRRYQTMAEDGDELNMDRVWRGDFDEAWHTTKRAQRRGIQRVLFMAEVGLSACTNHDAVFWRGAACLRMCDILQRSGFNTKIVATYSSARMSDEAKECVIAVPVKEYHEPLDMDSLASTVCNAAFSRREMFRAFDLTPGTLSCGLGCPSAAIANAYAERLAERHGAMLFSVGHNINSEASAKAWVDSCADKLMQLFGHQMQAA